MHTKNAVLLAYVDTGALDVVCPACGAKVDNFCRHESGADRKMPCPRRISAAAKAAAQAKDQS